jgi:hypothetical protein
MNRSRWEKIFIPVLLGASFVLLSRDPGVAHKKKTADSEEVRYSTHIEKLVAEKCLDCHGPDSPEHRNFTSEDAARGIGPRLDTYSHLVGLIGWPDTGFIQRNIDDGGAGDKPGKMYKYLGSSEEERQKNLSLFKDWVGYWTLKRWPEVTKEELARLKLAY